MGKLLRWFTDGPYRRALPFWKAGGNDILFASPLGPESVVVDAGAYTGGFSERVGETWGARIWAFEPVGEFRREAEERLSRFDAKVLPYGLSSADALAKLNISADGSSAFVGSGATVVDVEFRDVSKVFGELGFERVDLLAVNIEGAEYDLLDRLIETGWMPKVEHLLVQFHPFIPKYRRRYWAIRRALKKTHRLEWRFPWVWESWRRVA